MRPDPALVDGTGCAGSGRRRNWILQDPQKRLGLGVRSSRFRPEGLHLEPRKGSTKEKRTPSGPSASWTQAPNGDNVPILPERDGIPPQMRSVQMTPDLGNEMNKYCHNTQSTNLPPDCNSIAHQRLVQCIQLRVKGHV